MGIPQPGGQSGGAYAGLFHYPVYDLEVKSSNFWLSESGSIGLGATSYLLGDGVWISSDIGEMFRVGNEAASRFQWTDVDLEFYNQDNDLVVSIGETTKIAGFNFDDLYIWSGTKQTLDDFTVSGITIAGEGAFRAKEFRLDSDGSAYFKGAITGGTIEIGSGNSILKVDENGLFIGNADKSSAPFQVDYDGNIIASSLKSSGSIPYFELTEYEFEYVGNGGEYIKMGNSVLGGYTGIDIRANGGGLQVGKVDGSNRLRYDTEDAYLVVPRINFEGLHDAELYRGAADTVSTDNHFEIGGNIINNYIRLPEITISGDSSTRVITINCNQYDSDSTSSDRETVLVFYISQSAKAGIDATFTKPISLVTGNMVMPGNQSKSLPHIVVSDNTGEVEISITGGLGSAVTRYINVSIFGVMYSESFEINN